MTFTELAHPRAAAGTFTEKTQSAAELTLTVLRSDFIDETIANQEAAAIFAAGNAWPTAEDFEAKLFDTYDDAAYAADLADQDSELNMLRNQLGVYDLPSGGKAVFFD
jgi:hypothetical protein